MSYAAVRHRPPRQVRFYTRLTGHVMLSRLGLHYEPPGWMSTKWHLRLCTHCATISSYLDEHEAARRG